jgi:hypothetical protein
MRPETYRPSRLSIGVRPKEGYMPHITISVPDEWAEVIEPSSIQRALLDLLRDGVRESSDRICMWSECDWRDSVGEPIPRLVGELDRLQSLISAARDVAAEEEAEQVVRLSKARK